MYLQRESFLEQCSLTEALLSCFTHFASFFRQHFLGNTLKTAFSLTSKMKWEFCLLSTVMDCSSHVTPTSAAMLWSTSSCQSRKDICLERPMKCIVSTNATLMIGWGPKPIVVITKSWIWVAVASPSFSTDWLFVGDFACCLRKEVGGMANRWGELKILSPSNLELKSNNITVFRKISL